MARRTIQAILYLTIAAPLAFGSTREVRWQDLPKVVEGKRAVLELPDGVRVEGKVMSVDPEALTINIRKSTDKVLHPIGTTQIPRVSVSEIAVIRGKTLWRILGATAGGALGGVACGFAVLYMADRTSKMAGVCALAVGAGAGLGYAAGSVGPSRNRIRVVP